MNLLDEGRVRECKWISPLLDFPVYYRSQDSMPIEYWSAILTSRLLELTRKAEISFEIYNPHLCARQFGVAQECTIPFVHIFNWSLARHPAIIIENAPTALVKIPALSHQGAAYPSLNWRVDCLLACVAFGAVPIHFCFWHISVD